MIMKRIPAWRDKLPSDCMALETGTSGLAVKKRRFRFHPVLFISLTLFFVILLGLVFQAMGFNMWSLLVSWDDETMKVSFYVPESIKSNGIESGLEPAVYDAFFQKLDEFKMTPLLPYRFPEGFTLKRVESKIESDYLRWVVGSYLYGDRNLQVLIYMNTLKNTAGFLNIEKDEREPDIFDLGGIRFYVMDNLNNASAFWYDPPYNVQITGRVTRDEIKQMIDSIFIRK
jgi:hypothetical protein